jgi:hypothetical protein
MYPTKADAPELPGTDTSGTFYGTVSDEGSPTIGAIIKLFQSGIAKQGTATDIDGHFEFRDLPVGSYDVEIQYVGCYTLKDTVGINGKTSIGKTYVLKVDPRPLPETMIMMGQVSVGPAYLIDNNDRRESRIKRFLKGLFRKRN